MRPGKYVFDGFVDMPLDVHPEPPISIIVVAGGQRFPDDAVHSRRCFWRRTAPSASGEETRYGSARHFGASVEHRVTCLSGAHGH